MKTGLEKIWRAEQQASYDARRTKQIHLKLNLGTDADIIKWLNERGSHGESVQGSIKRLIRSEIIREKE